MRERAARLGIIDPKLGAADLATDRIIPVQEVDPGRPIAVNPGSVFYDSAIEDVSGLASFAGTIMAGVPAVNSQVLSLGFRFTGDADGSPSYVRLMVAYQLPVGQEFRIIDSTKLFYTNGTNPWEERFALGGWAADLASPNPVVVSSWNWPGYVPPDVPIYVRIDKSNTAVFPANTSFEWKIFAARWAEGDMRPF